MPRLSARGSGSPPASPARREPPSLDGALPAAIAAAALWWPAFSEASTVVTITTIKIAARPSRSTPGASSKVRGRPKACAVSLRNGWLSRMPAGRPSRHPNPAGISSCPAYTRTTWAGVNPTDFMMPISRVPAITAPLTRFAMMSAEASNAKTLKARRKGIITAVVRSAFSLASR